MAARVTPSTSTAAPCDCRTLSTKNWASLCPSVCQAYDIGLDEAYYVAVDLSGGMGVSAVDVMRSLLITGSQTTIYHLI